MVRKSKYSNYPVVPLRGITTFPNIRMSTELDSAHGIQTASDAFKNATQVLVITQRDNLVTEPSASDLFKVGTICSVDKFVRLSNDVATVFLTGIKRAAVQRFDESPAGGIVAQVNDEAEQHGTVDLFERGDLNTVALMRTAVSLFEEYISLTGFFSQESLTALKDEMSPAKLADVIISNIVVPAIIKQSVLEEFDAAERLNAVIALLQNENAVARIQKDIFEDTKRNLDKNQRDFFLREQLHVISEQLGDEDGIPGEAEAYMVRANKKKLPDEVMAKLKKEVDRFRKIPVSSPESSYLRSYIELILDIPWTNGTRIAGSGPMGSGPVGGGPMGGGPVGSVKKAEKVLNEDHYGLRDVKERIIEHLAVAEYTAGSNTPILCLAGPPGVGKTSIAHSIAKALNRKYIRISLGGIRDEADIRGHRRTYVASMPGRIITAVKNCGVNNPLILLDEIDKLGADYKGDPSAALLELLDSEQNNAFHDHYLEIPFDMSKTFFICTANTVDAIPPALRDRLEIISLSGYTEHEKLNIALKHLIPKQLKRHGLNKRLLKISQDAVEIIISKYTKEAGVRQLERYINRICRKAVKQQLDSKGGKCMKIDGANIQSVLGVYKFDYKEAEVRPQIGVARGLAWTMYGGDTLSIEVNVMPGAGKLELTGQMGNVMKESATAAISYIRSQADSGLLRGTIDIDSYFYIDKDIHIHIPEGATPKDGPSAGITMALAMISALSGVKIRGDVGMTGEITIRGRVLPIGGIKEKVAAAKRCGLKRIILPQENMSELEELAHEIKEGLEFVPVSQMNDVLEAALWT